MKKQAKKWIAIALALALLMTAFGMLSVSAEETDNTVRVRVMNNTFLNDAPWIGQLLDTDVTLQDNDSMESVIEHAITNEGYAFTVSQYGYISSINGLAEYAANGNGGWMATLNNWFTADGTTAYTVANGGLQAGDVIDVMFTCSWGADVGSLYGDFDTSLNYVDVYGPITEDSNLALIQFDSDCTEYTLDITVPEAELKFYPEANNKNYQTRTYLNNYEPAEEGAEIRYGRSVSVQNGDTVYVGVGNPAWPSMNSWAGTAEETVYTFHIRYAPVLGDFNGNGMVDIQDTTKLQRYLAEFEDLTAEELAIADVNGDHKVNVNDVTDMQRILAHIIVV